jgi:hypothetical protein
VRKECCWWRKIVRTFSSRRYHQFTFTMAVELTPAPRTNNFKTEGGAGAALTLQQFASPRSVAELVPVSDGSPRAAPNLFAVGVGCPGLTGVLANDFRAPFS